MLRSVEWGMTVNRKVQLSALHVLYVDTVERSW
jgi:hypothetical protein